LASRPTSTRDFEAEFTGNQSRGYSPGQTINIKKPPRYTYRAGRVSVPQSTTETTIPLTLSQGGTDLGFTGLERAVSVQQLEQKIMAAVATVANEIDRQGLDLAHYARSTLLGTVGTARRPSRRHRVITDQPASGRNGRAARPSARADPEPRDERRPGHRHGGPVQLA
jgi:hypothetical protein